MSEAKTTVPADIPTVGAYQYIYKKDLHGIVEVDPIPGYSFKYIDNIFDVDGAALREMSAFWNLPMLLRGIAKIITPSRKFYYIVSGEGSASKLVSYGWITIGKCKRYKIGKKSIVIGLIWTDEKERGKGIAVCALLNTLNVLFKNGYREIYIDTFIDNIGPQKVFKKCGFQGPIDFYLTEKNNKRGVNINMPIEKVSINGRESALIIRCGNEKEGVRFFTEDDSSLQVGKHYYSGPKIIKPHRHQHLKTELHGPSREVLYIEKGKVKISFYSDDNKIIDQKIIISGDLILLMEGGHSFEFLEETQMIEVKQGPYNPDSTQRFEANK